MRDLLATTSGQFRVIAWPIMTSLRAALDCVPSIDTRGPVILMVLAATAVPMGLRSPLGVKLEVVGTDLVDILENILGYLIVGIVLARMRPWKALLIAAAMSVFAESSQWFMVYRDPSLVDVATNVLGAALGILAAVRLDLGSRLRVSPPVALAAAGGVVALGLLMWQVSGSPVSEQGHTLPGRLEGRWELDDPDARFARDSSGQGLEAKYHSLVPAGSREPGSAFLLGNADDYVDLGHPSALRLIGSMSITAWIRSTSYPVDDAAILSSLGSVGFQLDTTVDSGQRTIGFKLTNACAGLMARYGATPLTLDTWYHVAGVYDAKAKTLDVYLNGQLDNGRLAGKVTGRQKSSRGNVFIGRRGDSPNFGFEGELRDVRIYSWALTAAQVFADMKSRVPSSPGEPSAAARGSETLPAAKASPGETCEVAVDPDDARAPGGAAAFGALVALALVGLRSTARTAALIPLGGVAAGAALMPLLPSTLPATARLVLFIAAIAGSTSVWLAKRSCPIRDGDESSAVLKAGPG